MSLFSEFPLGEAPLPPSSMLIGLPGISPIGRRIIDRVLQITKSSDFLKIVPHFLPDVLMVEDEGNPYVPGLELYRSNKGEPSVISVTSKFQIDLIPSPFSYWIAEYIVRKAKELSCNRIIALSAIVGKKPGIFYASNKEELSYLAASVGLNPISSYYLEGLSSLVLPISKLYRIPSIMITFQVSASGSVNPSFVNDGFGYVIRLLDLKIP